MAVQKESRIKARFEFLKQAGQTAFIPFITAGDPSLDRTKEFLYRLKEAGADIIEIGIPYSDPLADGPVIQSAALRALRGGTTLPQVMELIRDVRKEGFDLPLILFTYVNPVFQRGLLTFFQEAAEAGVDGVIIPDLPVEESQEAREVANKYGLDLIPLIAPTSQERIARICETASGFVYCVATLGVTGARESVSDFLPDFVKSVRQHATVPVAVGFGVSNGEQAAEISGYADGVIVGSALVRKIADIANAIDQNDEAQVLSTLDLFSQFAESIHAPLKCRDK